MSIVGDTIIWMYSNWEIYIAILAVLLLADIYLMPEETKDNE